MPDIFKALATTTAWALFIAGWIHNLTSFVAYAAGGFAGEDWQRQATFVGIGTVCFVLSVVVMKLRKGLE
jgi:hypothetical protein